MGTPFPDLVVGPLAQVPSGSLWEALRRPRRCCTAFPQAADLFTTNFQAHRLQLPQRAYRAPSAYHGVSLTNLQ